MTPDKQENNTKIIKKIEITPTTTIITPPSAPESAVRLTSYSSKRRASDNTIRASLIPIAKKANISNKEFNQNSNSASSRINSTMPAEKPTPRARSKATPPPANEPDII